VGYVVYENLVTDAHKELTRLARQLGLMWRTPSVENGFKVVGYTKFNRAATAGPPQRTLPITPVVCRWVHSQMSEVIAEAAGLAPFQVCDHGYGSDEVLL